MVFMHSFVFVLAQCTNTNIVFCIRYLFIKPIGITICCIRTTNRLMKNAACPNLLLSNHVQVCAAGPSARFFFPNGFFALKIWPNQTGRQGI